MTAEQLHILQHALGLDAYGQGKMYRNHFCAGGADEAICRSLVEMGYMLVFHPNESPLPYYSCSVTDAGKAAVLAESPKPPKLTRGQKRYRASLKQYYGSKVRP
jgi:hypothetical protein